MDCNIARNGKLGWAIAFASIGALSFAGEASADSLRVRFDVGYTAECRDVTSEEFASANPDERLIEAKLEVSSLIHTGREDDLIEFFYRFESPYRSLQIVDYLPKTTLESDLAGNVGIENKSESAKSMGLAVTGSFDYLLKGTLSGDRGSKQASSVRYELLPPLEMLAASGTINRHTGVYFKLKPSRRTSLEGGKQFVLRMRVPRYWRGDVLRVVCQATGFERSVIQQFDSKVTSGAGDFVVALYLEGDENAKTTVSRFVQREAELHRVAKSDRKQIAAAAYPTFAHKLGAAFDAAGPRVPTDWLEQIQRDATTVASFESHLPRDVRRAVSDYRTATFELLEMNGQQPQVAHRVSDSPSSP